MAMGIYDLGTARGLIRFTYDGGGLKQAKSDMDETGKKHDQLQKKLIGAGMMLGRVGIIAGAATLAVTGGMAAIGALGLSTASQVEQADIAFTTMLGSGQKADAFLKQLADFAAKTPFEFPDLVSASQKLLAMGFSADQVVPTLTAIGDAVAGLGGGPETIDAVTRAMGQMQAKGKVASDEMLQLTEQGIPAWDMLAKKMGVTVPEAMKAVEKGAVSANTGISALVDGMNKNFGGMMEKQSQTLAGLFSTLKDTVRMGLAQAEQGAMPALRKMLQDLIAASGPAMEQVGKLFTALTPVITGLAGQIAPLLSGLSSMLSGAAPQIAEFMKVFVGGIGKLLQALAPAMPAVMELVNVLGDSLIRILIALMPAIKPLATAFADIVRAISPALLIVLFALVPLLQALAQTISIIAPALPYLLAGFLAFKALAFIPKLLKAIQMGWVMLNVVWMASPIGLIITALVALGAGIYLAYKHFKGFRDVVEVVWKALQKGFDWIWGFLKKWGPLILAVLMPFIGIPLLIINNWDKIAKFFTDLGKTILDALSTAGEWLLGVGKAIINGLWTGIKWAWDNIIWPFISGLWDFIMGFLTRGAGQVLWKPGLAVFQGLMDAFKWAWDNIIWPYVIGIPLKLIGFFIDAVKWLWNAGVNIVTGLFNGMYNIASTILVWIGKNISWPIINFFVSAIKWLWNAGINIVTGLFSGMANIASTVSRWLFDHIFAPIGNFFKNGAVGVAKAADWLIGAGGDIIAGLLSGIWKAVQGIGNWIKTYVVDPFINAVKDFFGIRHSPSEIMKPFGQDIMAGLFEGMIRVNPIEMVKKIFGGMPQALARMLSKGLVSFLGLPKWAEEQIANLGEGFLKSIFASSPAGMITQFMDMLSGAIDVGSDLWGLIFGGGGKGQKVSVEFAGVQQLGKDLADLIYGWTGAQWTALNNLVMGESGWNPTAQNPTSTAYGIAQNIGGPTGYPDQSPRGQILWMLQYILDRYGDPIRAYQAWMKRSPHWYDTGGFLPSNRPALVGVPELWIPKVSGMMFPLAGQPAAAKSEKKSGPTLTIENAYFEDKTDMQVLLNQMDFYYKREKL
jgi:tape measure domain-containing protein